MFAAKFLRTAASRSLQTPISTHSLQLRAASTNFSRLYASTTTATPPPLKTPKPKPNRSATALKRTASASLSIRDNPTPTRGNIQPVFTFSTAERYNLTLLEDRITSAVRFEEALWIPLWTHKGEDCEVWVFANGSIVLWGAGEDAARAFVSHMLEMGSPNVQINKLDHAESEQLDFVTDPNETTRLQGDLIILGRAPSLNDLSMPEPQYKTSNLPIDTAASRYAFSHALAQSTSLGALESSLEDYLHSVVHLPATLSRTGKPGLERKELIKKLGELLRLRQSLNLTEESFGETPDFYWAQPVLEDYFNSVSNALEIKTRTKSVNDKITYAAELQSTLRELLTESTAHRMELIIIALIAVEVVIAFIRDGPELWEGVFGSSDAEEKPKKSSHKH